MIDAYPGLGKSTIAQVFAREFHQRQVSLYGPVTEGGHDRIPVAHVCLTSSTSKRSFNAMLCRFFGLPGHDKGNAEELGHKAADAVLACDVRLCVVDDVHFLDVARRDGRDVANHFKYLANTFPVTFLFVGVGLERRGLIREGLAAGEEALAQNARRWTTLGVSPFEITTEAGRRTWRQLLLAIEKDLVLAGAHPGMVADDLAGLPVRPQHRALRLADDAHRPRLPPRRPHRHRGTHPRPAGPGPQRRRRRSRPAGTPGRVRRREAVRPPGRSRGGGPGTGRLRPFMPAIPIRLAPLPGEALDSWLEAYAHLLHATVRDIFAFAGVDWDRVNGDQRTSKPWLHRWTSPT